MPVPGPGTRSPTSSISGPGFLPNIERALFRGAVGESAAVVFSAFLKIWREIPHPAAIIADPENADVPTQSDVLVSLCGALFNMADDTNFDAIVAYATRLRREIGEFLVTMCIKRDPDLQNTAGFIRWAAPPHPVTADTPLRHLAATDPTALERCQT